MLNELLLPNGYDAMMSPYWAICQIQKRGGEGEVEDLNMRKRKKLLSSLECNFYEGKTLFLFLFTVLYSVLGRVPGSKYMLNKYIEWMNE